MHETLPIKTVRDLGALLVCLTELAWDGTKTAIERIAPFFRPPDDMRITTDEGVYTGVVVVEENDVTAGAVVRVGQEAPNHGTPRQIERPWSSSSRHDDEPGTALRHWAIDSRDDEDDPWRR